MRLIRRVWIALAFPLSACLMTAPSGSPETGYTVQGFVGQNSVTPAPMIQVDLLEAGTARPVATTQTNYFGGYSFAGLPPGNYVLQVEEVQRQVLITNQSVRFDIDLSARGGHDGLRGRCGGSPYWLRFREGCCGCGYWPQRPATSAADRRRVVGIRRLDRATDWAVPGRDLPGVPGVELFRPFVRLARQRDNGVGLGQPGARGRPLDDHGRHPGRYGPRHVRQRENCGDPLPPDWRSGMSGFQRQHPVPEVCDVPMTVAVWVCALYLTVLPYGVPRLQDRGTGRKQQIVVNALCLVLQLTRRRDRCPDATTSRRS